MINLKTAKTLGLKISDEFISLLGGAGAWPLPARAQPAGDAVRYAALRV